MLGALADSFFEDQQNSIRIKPMKSYEEYLEGERILNMLQQAQGGDGIPQGGGGNTLSKDKALLNAL